MNCYYHEERPAVAQCIHCGVGLCRSCAEQYSDPTCEGCADAIVATLKKEAKRKLRYIHVAAIITLICCMFLVFMEISSGVSQDVLVVLLATPVLMWIFAGLPSGWRALNKIPLNFILVLPIIGWIFYFYIKGMLAFMVGIIAMPIEYVKCRKILKS